MALDLSDEALGLPSLKKEGNGLDLSDEALGVPPPKQLSALEILRQRQLTPDPVLQEMKAFEEGLYSMVTSGFAAIRGSLMGIAVEGKPAGDIFREEFDKLNENAADIYKPLTPEAGTLVHKMGELISAGLHGAGGFVFEKGLPLPGPLGVAAPRVRVGKGSPFAAAATETTLVGGALLSPFGRRAPTKPGGPPPPPTWEEFATKYPETAKSIDASSLGDIRWRREDTSVADAINRQMDTELGLSGAASELPFRTKATMVFDKVAPTVPLGEKLRAVQALERKIQVLDAARLNLSQRRGLPQPEAISIQPITVTAEGVAITPRQARTIIEEFRSKTPSERADAMGVSVMGQLQAQYHNVAKHKAGSPEYNMELSALDRMFKQAFPDEVIGKRAEAFDAFMNFEGKLSYPQVLEKLGPTKKVEARLWRKYEAGAIDIEGMEYLLNSFKDLPNQPVLKRATIVGQLNRQGVPQAEKDVVLRALRDRDTITQAELVGSVAADILPLKAREIDLHNPNTGIDLAGGLERVGGLQRESPALLPSGADMVWTTTDTARVWRMPIKTEIVTHFDDPAYFAHTRGFDKQSVRHIAEIQSDLMQAVRPTRREELAVASLPSPTLLEAAPQAIPLQKRWYERILMEENRQASRDGMRKMRVATADTLAKVQYWIRGPKEGEHNIPPTLIPTHFEPVTAVRVRGGELSEIFVGYGRSGTWVNAKIAARLDDSPLPLQAVVNVVPREGLSPAHQGIYNFYKNEVAAFTRSRFDAREIVDEFNNTWMEWSVRAEDAHAKIPAFGGRGIRSTGPGGKQHGAINIPEFEDVVKAAERGQAAAEVAAERGWAVPKPADDQLFKKANDAFEASRAAEEAGRKITMSGALKRLRQETVAHDYDLRKELANAGTYGQKAVDRLALQNGATMAAKSRMDAINDRIFNDLDSMTKGQLDVIVRLRRIMEIDSYKGVGKHKHAEDITGPEAEAIALRFKESLGDEQFAKVYELSNRVFKEYKDVLNRRFESGVLSEESYLKLLHFDYTPIKFIDLIDPMQTFMVRGHPISVRTSGVPFLERGKQGAVMMDSQLLLAEALIRSENLIFRNETLKQLHELATKVPENPVVRLMPKGSVSKPGTEGAVVKHTPKGYVALGVRVEGKQEFIAMREDLAEQFIHRPQVLPEYVGTAARWLSGTATLKATATTYNPGFIVSGLPMDILHTWLATTRVYSPHLPKFAGQMAADLAATARDAWTRGPEYQQALREGLGSAFMTHEGRGFTGITIQSRSVVERQMRPRFDKQKAALSFFNERADIWVRMAHRHRLMREVDLGDGVVREGLPSWQATAQARNRLDYSAGGQLTKAIDTVQPYTNVAVQSLSKVIQAGARDKGDLATKLAWGGGAITAWVMANILSSPETWKQMSTSDKIRSLPITFGDQWYVLDPDGNKRYVYWPGVRLDAVVGPIAAVIVGGLEQAEFGRAPDDIISRSIRNINPVLEFEGPPTMTAIQTYLSNYDAFTGRPVSPQFGQVKPEHEGRTYGRGEPPSAIARAIGGLTGMSPPRLDAAARKVIAPNTYLDLMGWGYRPLFEGTDPRVMSEATEQTMMRDSTIRRFIKLTNPSTQYLRDVGERREEEGSRRKQMTDSVDDLLFQVRKGQASLSDVKTYVRNQPGEDREWLTNYATTSYHVKEVMKRFMASEGVPNESWWRAVSTLHARPRAQEFHSQWLSADPDNRRRMEKIAVGLHRAGAGFYSDDFRRELAKERALLGEEQR